MTDRKQYARNYYKRNREKLSAYHREYSRRFYASTKREQIPEEKLTSEQISSRNYYIRHREAIKARNAAYRKAHRAQANAAKRRRYQKAKEANANGK